jgi:hypothetical protein
VDREILGIAVGQIVSVCGEGPALASEIVIGLVFPTQPQEFLRDLHVCSELFHLGAHDTRVVGPCKIEVWFDNPVSLGDSVGQ